MVEHADVGSLYGILEHARSFILHPFAALTPSVIRVCFKSTNPGLRTIDALLDAPGSPWRRHTLQDSLNEAHIASLPRGGTHRKSPGGGTHCKAPWRRHSLRRHTSQVSLEDAHIARLPRGGTHRKSPWRRHTLQDEAHIASLSQGGTHCKSSKKLSLRLSVLGSWSDHRICLDSTALGSHSSRLSLIFWKVTRHFGGTRTLSFSGPHLYQTAYAPGLGTCFKHLVRML